MKIKVTREQITAIFDQAQTPTEYVVSLFRLAHPDYDSIKQFKRYPRAGKTLRFEIMHQAMRWDQKHRLKSMPGGYILNYGFSSIEDETEDDGWSLIPCAADELVHEDVVVSNVE